MKNHPDLPDTEVVDHGTFNGINWWVNKLPRAGREQDSPQFNGYVELPENHPLHLLGNSYEDADSLISVHGGVTYREGNIIGFDTAHYMDTADSWPLSAVRGETINMANQVAETMTEENQEKAKRVYFLRGQIDQYAEELRSLGYYAEIY